MIPHTARRLCGGPFRLHRFARDEPVQIATRHSARGTEVPWGPAMNPAGRRPWCYLRVKLANSGGDRTVTTAVRSREGTKFPPWAPLQPPGGAVEARGSVGRSRAAPQAGWAAGPLRFRGLNRPACGRASASFSLPSPRFRFLPGGAVEGRASVGRGCPTALLCRAPSGA